MDEALFTLLCEQGPWTFKHNGHFWITFRSDGTGELVGFAYLHWLMCCNFEWKRGPTISSAAADVKYEPTNPKIQVVGSLKVEITLLKSLPTSVHSSDPHFAEARYRARPETDFEPHSFTITIERGEFVTDNDRIKPLSRDDRSSMPSRPKRKFYGLRLCFDQSPYPKARLTPSVEGDDEFDTYTHAVGDRFAQYDDHCIATNDEDDGNDHRCVLS